MQSPTVLSWRRRGGLVTSPMLPNELLVEPKDTECRPNVRLTSYPMYFNIMSLDV